MKTLPDKEALLAKIQKLREEEEQKKGYKFGTAYDDAEQRLKQQEDETRKD